MPPRPALLTALAAVLSGCAALAGLGDYGRGDGGGGPGEGGTDACDAGTGGAPEPPDEGELSDHGLIARWTFQELGLQQVEMAADASGNGHDLTIVQGNNLGFVNQGTGNGVFWLTAGLDGYLKVTASDRLIDDLAEAPHSMMIELVTGGLVGAADGSRLVHIGTAGGPGRLVLAIVDGRLELRTDGGARLAGWSVPSLTDRVVHHVCVDLCADPPVEAYANGQQMSADITGPPSALELDPAVHAVVLGNREAGDQSPEGNLTYAALYRRCLPPDILDQQAQRLLANDDE